MKSKILYIAFFLLLFVSCRKQTLQTGDLIFVGLNLDSMSAYGELTYIHTAIAEVTDSGTYIIDATLIHGVDRHPLAVFFEDFTLKDGSLPVFDVMRLKDNAKAASYVENAKKFVGQKYNIHFTKSDTAKYCTELIRDSYIADGKFLFDEKPLDFTDKNGEMPQYWPWLFGLLNCEVPQGKMGVLPKEMAQSDLLEKVDVIVQ